MTDKEEEEEEKEEGEGTSGKKQTEKDVGEKGGYKNREYLKKEVKRKCKVERENGMKGKKDRRDEN